MMHLKETLQFTKGACDIIKPEVGKLVAFTAGLNDTHKVNIVTSGTRYTLACWFTNNASKAISGSYKVKLKNAQI